MKLTRIEKTKRYNESAKELLQTQLEKLETLESIKSKTKWTLCNTTDDMIEEVKKEINESKSCIESLSRKLDKLITK